MRQTELDDAVEQVLGRYIPDTLDRIRARNEIVSLIATAGHDVFAQVPEPTDLRPAALITARTLTTDEALAIERRLQEAMNKPYQLQVLIDPAITRRRWWQFGRPRHTHPA
jgi:hypothetical protein